MAYITGNRILWSSCGHNLSKHTLACPLCLQRQLQQAQEEHRFAIAMWDERFREVEGLAKRFLAKRDAAIRRAEAAERDAAKQRALAGAKDSCLRQIEKVLGPKPPERCGCCAGCQWEMGEALRLTRAGINVTPAEAQEATDD